MGSTPICHKKQTYSNELREKTLVRVKTVPAEEIMRKSVWFIEKEEVDNYFSKEELHYYRKTNQETTKMVDMQIPTQPEKIRWREGELIGQGSFGEVMMGFNEDNGQIMAVKQVNLKILQNDESKISALELEIEILKQLKHENIVTYLGTQKSQNKLLIFLEYLSGGSISSLLKKYGSLNETIIRVYTTQILRGLEYLHYKNVMHRDIKGANILLETGGICKLADFGSSKQINQLNQDNNTLTGTANWMPPEIIQQTKGGRFSDIWSLGCTVIEMATGKPPWSEFNNPLTVMFNIASNKQPPPLPSGLSKETLDFLEKCLQVDPFKRYNCYKLLRHNFITGQSLLLKTPDTLNIVRRNLKELSEIVENDDNLSAHSSLNIQGKDSNTHQSISPKLGIESEMVYKLNTITNESPKLLHLEKVTSKIYESGFTKNLERPKINILLCGEYEDTTDADLDEHAFINMRYSFKGPDEKKR